MFKFPIKYSILVNHIQHMVKEKVEPKMPGDRSNQKTKDTRLAILHTAIRLFRERGYDDTTMRLIAQEAGVSLGNAYYYFPSKDHLVHNLYEQMYEEQLAASDGVLQQQTLLKDRLLGCVLADLTVLEPYHKLCVSLFKSAADPESPLSPFGAASRDIRLKSIAMYAKLVSDARENLPADLMEELPFLLWLFKMGVVLFWIHDRSPGRSRTHFLVQHSVELISALAFLLSNPMLLPVRRRILKLVCGLKAGEMPAETAS